ncbi:MAG: hypothetical protein FJ025_03180 [Chloroflexi bacterium]|nr:hypothetical protein [Chloroflexota bacterium]
MLDRKVVEEFLDSEFEDWELEIPQDISKDELVETFCQFTEDDYYEWLQDNFHTFFNHGNPDWDWIKGRIKHYEKLGNR